jgi:transcriptional regulator with XRE-family HTH domain
MINDALRLVRLYWGLTQAETAERVGVSQSLISEVEKYKKEASLDLIQKYSESMGVRLSQLLFFAEELENQPPARQGSLFVAEHILRLLERLKPSDRSAA